MHLCESTGKIELFNFSPFQIIYDCCEASILIIFIKYFKLFCDYQYVSNNFNI